MNVEEWLRTLYAAQKRSGAPYKPAGNASDVPPYEKNKTTHEVLSGLHAFNSSADRQIDEEMNIMNTLIEEYSAERRRLEEILKTCGFAAKGLPQELQTLARTISLATQQAQKLEEVDACPHEVVDLGFSQTESLQHLQNLERVQESLNQMLADDSQDHLTKKKETEFLKKKTTEYAGHIRHLEKKLETVDYQPDEIRHGVLEQRAKQLMAANDKLSQLRSKLGVYADLTPDVNLARMQVQSLKDELSQLETQIADNITNINSN